MKALLLDLDDTLVDERHAVRMAFSAFIEAHRDCFQDVSDETLHSRWREVTLRHWVRCERGEVSFQDQRRHRLREFLDRPLTDAEADEAFAPYRSTYLASLRLFEDVPIFLARTEHLARIIVTNGDRPLQERKMEATGLSSQVTAMLTPMDCDSWKPDPGIFVSALEKLGVAADQCAMIGDDEVRDIEPARKLGMQAFRVAAGHPERTLLKALEALSI